MALFLFPLGIDLLYRLFRSGKYHFRNRFYIIIIFIILKLNIFRPAVIHLEHQKFHNHGYSGTDKAPQYNAYRRYLRIHQKRSQKQYHHLRYSARYNGYRPAVIYGKPSDQINNDHRQCKRYHHYNHGLILQKTVHHIPETPRHIFRFQRA